MILERLIPIDGCGPTQVEFHSQAEEEVVLLI
jgi:hypothetical protein